MQLLHMSFLLAVDNRAVYQGIQNKLGSSLCPNEEDLEDRYILPNIATLT